DAANISWARGIFERLRPAMKPGVYVNFMSGDEQSRVPEAYHQRWERMVAIKSHYDPQNFFRLNQNVPPRRVAAEGWRIGVSRSGRARWVRLRRGRAVSVAWKPFAGGEGQVFARRLQPLIPARRSCCEPMRSSVVATPTRSG